MSVKPDPADRCEAFSLLSSTSVSNNRFILIHFSLLSCELLHLNQTGLTELAILFVYDPHSKICELDCRLLPSARVVVTPTYLGFGDGWRRWWVVVLCSLGVCLVCECLHMATNGCWLACFMVGSRLYRGGVLRGFFYTCNPALVMFAFVGCIDLSLVWGLDRFMCPCVVGSLWCGVLLVMGLLANLIVVFSMSLCFFFLDGELLFT